MAESLSPNKQALLQRKKTYGLKLLLFLLILKSITFSLIFILIITNNIIFNYLKM